MPLSRVHSSPALSNEVTILFEEFVLSTLILIMLYTPSRLKAYWMQIANFQGKRRERWWERNLFHSTHGSLWKLRRKEVTVEESTISDSDLRDKMRIGSCFSCVFCFRNLLCFIDTIFDNIHQFAAGFAQILFGEQF